MVTRIRIEGQGETPEPLHKLFDEIGALVAKHIGQEAMPAHVVSERLPGHDEEIVYGWWRSRGVIHFDTSLPGTITSTK